MYLTLARVTACIAFVPVAVLIVLAASGQAAEGPALSGMLLVAASAFGLAVLWARAVRTLSTLLHMISTGTPRGQCPAWFGPELRGQVALLSDTLSEQTALLDRLQRAEESVVERLPDPLILLSRNRDMLRANAAARLAFGADIAAVLRHPDLRAAIDRALAGGAQGGAQTADLRVPVPMEREVQAVIVPLDGPPNSPLFDGAGVLAVLRDRSRERAVERMRADFVANASHELRTPLASLIGFIDTLRGPAADDPPAQARFLEIMAEQALRMNRLIDDLLSLSRIEITEHQPPDGQVDMEGVIERVLSGLEITIANRLVRIDYTPQPGLPRVCGDADQLEQVTQNLLDNALKYGKAGGVVNVALEAVAPGGKWPARPGVLFCVRDDGQGIPRQHLPRLTERFYRVDNGRSRAVGGTGLGLAIVKHIVNRHRGVLAIESEAGKGATFIVWLPATT